MKKLLLLLLLAVGCSQPSNPAPPIQTPPPLEAPIPTPPTAQPILHGTVNFTAYMSPRWFNYKRPRYAYYLEWQNPDGSWRPALTNVDILGEGWVGWMSEVQPTITRRLPVGNYRVVYGLPKGAYTYYHNEPWEERFTLTPDAEVHLRSTLIWE